MAKIIIDINRKRRKNNPIDIEIIQSGFDFEMKEVLLYAIRAVFDEEKEIKERLEVIRGNKKDVQQKNYRHR